MSSVKNLKPEKVLEFFELISSVPRGSGNVGKISKLCCEFAQQRGLHHIQDAFGNVIIFKPASTGYETHDPVIIQGHMDMVAVKKTQCNIDLENDGLSLITDGE